MKPLVLLDVDGVLNWWSDGEVREPMGLRKEGQVWFPEWMPQLVQDLVSRCEVVWCTAWRHVANDIIAPLMGIDPLPVIDAEGAGAEWKLGAVVEFLAGRDPAQPVVWVEDFDSSWRFLWPHEVMGALRGRVTFVDTSAVGMVRREDLGMLFDEEVSVGA